MPTAVNCGAVCSSLECNQGSCPYTWIFDAERDGDACEGKKTCKPKKIAVSVGAPSSGVLRSKSLRGEVGIGVAADATADAEIGPFEVLKVVFDAPVIVEELELTFLYPAGVDGHFVREVAHVHAGMLVGTLTSFAATTAFWEPSATVMNLSPATGAGAGAFRVEFPFGDLLTTELNITVPNSSPTIGVALKRIVVYPQ